MTSSSVQQARQALGRRLREIRKDAGLTARELARRADWHESKCSRLENGRTAPSDADIRMYTTLCAAQDHAADLIATARGIEGTYVQWRRMERAGLRHVNSTCRVRHATASAIRELTAAPCPHDLEQVAKLYPHGPVPHRP
ncbi:helix-turn-helix transcriptional regulator [Streptomyces sp. ISL-22]|uniref:helix-turn-helix domain-containing protein n=1 Tax=unclassified Streptomyces TaxID=2593676 RepID=UPI001BEC8CD0|nr:MULTISPECIES: helix-turn-helix transcriptional regulator [unclassified Streptomyces]MBT2421920.1 helix-turn-helix transcriptional regulator [Streptomyces sp. ISL-24]MBT2433470.1 helix-turn-helix transcriptional regulator [Streptomyces sp. ISL-22]